MRDFWAQLASHLRSMSRCPRVVTVLLAAATTIGAHSACAQDRVGQSPSARLAFPSSRHALEARPALFATATARSKRGTQSLSVSPPVGELKTQQEAGSSYADPTRAVAYSLGGTLALIPIFGTGLIVGPAFGHFYAGDPEQAWRGIKIRAGAVVVPAVVWGASAAGLFSLDRHEDLFLGTLAAGATILLWSAIYDIFTAADSAREMNMARAPGPRLQVTPTVSGSRNRQVGLSMRVQF